MVSKQFGPKLYQDGAAPVSVRCLRYSQEYNLSTVGCADLTACAIPASASTVLRFFPSVLMNDPLRCASMERRSGYYFTCLR